MEELLALILFSASMMLTPGPNNILIMNSGLHFGIQKSLPHYMGICFGFALMVLLITLGLGAAMTDITWLKPVLKIVGASYMLYLAWCIYTAKVSTDGSREKKPFSFLHAALFQWINVKAWMMSIGVVSLFTISEDYLHNALIITLTYLVIGVPCIGIWLLGGAYLKRFLKEEKHYRRFNAIMASALVASIAMIFID